MGGAHAGERRGMAQLWTERGGLSEGRQGHPTCSWGFTGKARAPGNGGREARSRGGLRGVLEFRDKLLDSWALIKSRVAVHAVSYGLWYCGKIGYTNQ